MQRTSVVFAGAALVMFTGCGGGKHWSYNNKVEGTVKLDGTPLAGVVVEFVPDDPQVQGPTSRGYTNESGQFRLRADNRKSGAVIGRHLVVVLVGRGGDAQAGEGPGAESPAIAQARKKNPPVPMAYRTAGQTPLVVEVKPDEHIYDLTLSRNAAPRAVKKQ